MLSKVEIQILKHLNDNQIDNQMKSQTIKKLSQIMNLNYFRVRNIVTNLTRLELLYIGFKEGNANTYYISEKGVEKIKKSDFSTTLS